MSRLVTYTTAEGADVTIQVADEASEPGGMVTRGWGKSETVERVGENLDDALARVRPAIGAVIGQLRALTDAPDEFEVSFGIQISVGVGAFISAGSSANFSVTMRWLAPGLRALSAEQALGPDTGSGDEA